MNSRSKSSIHSHINLGLLERSTLAVEVSVTVATRHPAERFVIFLDFSHHSSTNVGDAEVTSIVRSPVPPPPLMTAAIATTAITDVISAPVLRVGTEPVYQVSTDTFYVSQYMDSETLQQIYVPKWNMINDSALDDP
ncbi:hypothetical protein Tco_1469087 [Tanacetum coccineum]